MPHGKHCSSSDHLESNFYPSWNNLYRPAKNNWVFCYEPLDSEHLLGCPSNRAVALLFFSPLAWGIWHYRKTIQSPEDKFLLGPPSQWRLRCRYKSAFTDTGASSFSGQLNLPLFTQPEKFRGNSTELLKLSRHNDSWISKALVGNLGGLGFGGYKLIAFLTYWILGHMALLLKPNSHVQMESNKGLPTRTDRHCSPARRKDWYLYSFMGYPGKMRRSI